MITIERTTLGEHTMSSDEQREQEDALILALCREVGPELNANGTTTESWTDTQKIDGFRGNHHPDLIRAAALGDVAALVQLRHACGLPAFV